ncbi:MAG: divalent metal cation transporter [Nibricoccus sp.]
MPDLGSKVAAPPKPRSNYPKKERSILKLLGPGLVTGAASDDPSRIATCSQAGAQFGYTTLWTMLLSYPLMSAVQMISAQIGRVTGHGIAGNMRQICPPWFCAAMVGAVILVNIVNIAANVSAMGASRRPRRGRSSASLWHRAISRLAPSSSLYAV